MNQNRFHSLGIRAVKVTVLIVTAITLRAFKSGIMSIHLKVRQSETGMIPRRGRRRHGCAGLQDGCVSNAVIFISHSPNLSAQFQSEGKHGSSKTSVVQFPTQIGATSPSSYPRLELQLSKSFYASPNKQCKQYEGEVMCCGYCFNGAIRGALLGVHTHKSWLHNYVQPPATLLRVVFAPRPCFHTQSSGRAVLPNLHIALSL